MPSLERAADKLRSLIADADTIVVGIGSGMSSAAGFNHYNHAGMARAGMDDWQRAFGFKSLFDGFYHLYPSLEQQWAYYARYIDFMLREPASQPYLDLRPLIGHKDYFILSTKLVALRYPSSSTGSSHSLEVSSPGTSSARWENQLSGAAPCQCFTPGAMLTTSPGRSSCAGLSHSW